MVPHPPRPELATCELPAEHCPLASGNSATRTIGRTCDQGGARPSPAARVQSDASTGNSRASDRNRTDPSANRPLAPPGWSLRMSFSNRGAALMANAWSNRLRPLIHWPSANSESSATSSVCEVPSRISGMATGPVDQQRSFGRVIRPRDSLTKDAAIVARSPPLNLGHRPGDAGTEEDRQDGGRRHGILTTIEGRGKGPAPDRPRTARDTAARRRTKRVAARTGPGRSATRHTPPETRRDSRGTAGRRFPVVAGGSGNCFRLAASRAAFTAGSSRPTRIATTAITTSNSTSVKPDRPALRGERRSQGMRWAHTLAGRPTADTVLNRRAMRPRSLRRICGSAPARSKRPREPRAATRGLNSGGHFYDSRCRALPHGARPSRAGRSSDSRALP